MKAKIKPPAETKAQLMESVGEALQRRYPHEPHLAIEFLLNFFTAFDLVGIREEVNKEKQRGTWI